MRFVLAEYRKWTKVIQDAGITLDVFGSDYPYRTGADNVKGLQEYGFTPSDLRAIERGNALRRLPRLGS